MKNRLWELEFLENIFLNDRGHLRYEVVYAILIIVLINVL